MHKYDLIVVGGSAQGISTAIAALKVGATSVRLLEDSSNVAYPDMVGQERLDVGYGESVEGISLTGDGLLVKTNVKEYETHTCVVALNSPTAVVEIPNGIETSERVHEGPYEGEQNNQDILVVGDNDRAVVLAAYYVAQGARTVVLAAKGMNPDLLSDASHDQIAKLEKDRRLTVLFRAIPKHIEDSQDGVWVDFGDNRTPKLVFDHVVFAAKQSLVDPKDIGIDDSVLSSGRLKYVRDPRLDVDLPSGTVNESIVALSDFFSSPSEEVLKNLGNRKRNYSTAPEDLREEFYNATITYFEKTHSDLWVIRVKPDGGDISHSPGQYSSLGLGYWEDRIDNASDPGIENKWDKLVRRSYSISNRIFNEGGYLASETENGELEFYIVLVPPTPENIPGLTPRLALKKPGDRIFLGSKATGHYTLKDVTDPDCNVVFFATGTGEAPNNSMIVQLLRNGHRGKIVSAVSVRHTKDLGYIDQHRRLEELYSNYVYVPMPTREPDIPKRYCQDFFTSGDLENILGVQITAENTQAFMCGNPAMIGAPDNERKLPEEQGMVGLLMKRGLKIAERKQSGQIHYDPFW